MDASVQLGDVGRKVDEQEALRLISQPGNYLFTNRICPFAHRAWWAAEETGFISKTDYIHIDLGEGIKPAWYSKVNPLGTVPCLYVDGKPVFESLIVAEYINDATKSNLTPKDPLAKAAVAFIISQFGDKVTGKLYGLLSNTSPEKFDDLLKELQTKMEQFDALVKKHQLKEGPYFNGEELSMVEIAIVPFLDRFKSTLLHYRGVDIMSFNIPTLRRMFEACQTRPAFKKTSQAPEFYIAAYKTYGKPMSAPAAAAPAAASSSCSSSCSSQECKQCPIFNKTNFAIGGAFALGALVTYATIKGAKL